MSLVSFVLVNLWIDMVAIEAVSKLLEHVFTQKMNCAVIAAGNQVPCCDNQAIDGGVRNEHSVLPVPRNVPNSNGMVIAARSHVSVRERN